jgi:GxxExxY protein
MTRTHADQQMEILYKDITNTALAGFYEIYRERGFGFQESVYSNSLAVEFGLRGLRVSREVPIEVRWKGVIVGTYRIDLLVNDVILVEVKAVERLIPAHEAQLLNYLKATGIEVGLLLNFGAEPQFRRRVLSRK